MQLSFRKPSQSYQKNGAVERTRTSTVLLPPAPQAGASASSATTAFHRLRDYSGEPCELRGSLRRIEVLRASSVLAPAPVAAWPESASKESGSKGPARCWRARWTAGCPTAVLRAVSPASPVLAWPPASRIFQESSRPAPHPCLRAAPAPARIP